MKIRLRHYRGHGIHSPFVYSLIRQALMNKNMIDNQLYQELVGVGIGRRTARQLQNVHSFCGFTKAEVIIRDGDIDYGTDFIILVDPTDGAVFERMVRNDGAQDKNAALAVVLRRRNKQIRGILESKIKEGNCLSIDNWRYFLFFFDDKLSPQHFKL